MPELLFFFSSLIKVVAFPHELGIISLKASDNPFGSTDKINMYSILQEWHGNYLRKVN